MATVSDSLRGGVAAARPLTRRDAAIERAHNNLLQRLLTRVPKPGLWAWLGPALVTALGGLLRFFRLGEPNTLVFDETYYVKQAYTLIAAGFEADWPEDPDAAFAAGDVDTYLGSAQYVVHPPVGKWLIGFGEWLFGGTSSFGWRFMGAFLGTVAIWMIARIARRLFGSNLLGALAGLLMAIDGNAIVMSRTGILDIYVMFFALAAFGALILDREQARRRLAHAMAPFAGLNVPAPAWGPKIGMRWWRLAAGVLLGFCIGVKWSGLYFLAVFGLMTVLWDIGARRAAGRSSVHRAGISRIANITHWIRAGVVKDGIPAFIAMVPVALATYVGTWAHWFISGRTYMRRWAEENPGEGITWLPESLRSFVEYHLQMWEFHTTLASNHPYKSNPLSWLLQLRPTSFFYESPSGCGAAECSRAITSLGNPVVWWGGTLALVAVILLWMLGRDWRAGAILAGIVGGYLPWLMYMNRTIYTFYTVAFEPWVVLSLVFGIGLLIGRTDATKVRKRWGIILAGVIVVLALAVAGFFWPIWSAEVIPRDDWVMRMWLESWI